MGDDSVSTIITNTQKTPHGSYLPHSYEEKNVDQSQPLPISSPDLDAPRDDGRDSHNRQNARFHFRALVIWKWETGSCLLAVGSLLAIVATVYPYDGHPLPQWPYGLSINSLISIYTTIMSAALCSILAQGLGQLKWTWFGNPRRLDHLESFDDASRGGALGAAKLLWVLRGRNPITAIGALVTILAVAIDPFSQQLANYYTCSQVVRGSEATIPKTNLYDNPGGSHAGAGERTINMSMQAAVYGGIFSPGTNRITANCPTGNCTFPQPYKTIAYCTACSDITSQLDIVTYNISTSVSNITVTNYTLPSGLQLSDYIGNAFVIGGAELNGTIIQTIMAADPSALTCSDKWPWGCTGFGAAECQISLCIKTFTGSVQMGTFVETEISTEQDTWLDSNESIWGSLEGSWYISTVDLTCLNNIEKETLRSAGYQFSDKTQWLAYNTSISAGLSVAAANASSGALPANYTEPAINGSCIYQTKRDTMASMNGFLLGAFDGQASLGPQSGPQASSSFISVIFNGGNVSAETFASTFQSVAESMTTNIRTYVDAYTPNYISGIVLKSDTCVDARWSWLIFPAVLVLLTIVFFAATIVQTRTRDAMDSGSQDYKGSALPLLFHGLEESTAAKFGRGQHGMAKMNQDASELCVAWRPTEVGWRFVAEDKS